MEIHKLYLENFRGFKKNEFTFDKQLNVIIGDNGSGKTAVLEALTISIGSFFLGLKDSNSRHIRDRDIRIQRFENYEIGQFPVVIKTTGKVLDESIEWTRDKDSLRGRTKTQNAQNLKNIAVNIDKQVRNGENVSLPLLAYYATGRLFIDVRGKADIEQKTVSKKINIASPFRAYNQCLEAKSTFQYFLKWFKGKELSKIQKSHEDFSLILVRKVMVNNIPNCTNIYYDFDPDNSPGLKMEFNDGRTLPFNYLSDGTRNYLALVADIAHKCVLLNPFLKENALLKTKGIVLIDELDLHLHPAWQQNILQSLLNSFPNIQFFVTTHSPFLIQETENGQLIKLKNSERDLNFVGAEDKSIEDIAEQIQERNNPQWSTKRKKLYDVGQKYYAKMAEGATMNGLKEEMTEAEKVFTKDTLFYPYLEALKAMQK
jgi:predicted ATP-binding protein involved in virulence